MVHGQALNFRPWHSTRATSCLIRYGLALPEGVRQVEIVKVGHSRLISPAGPASSRQHFKFMENAPKTNAIPGAFLG